MSLYSELESALSTLRTSLAALLTRLTTIQQHRTLTLDDHADILDVLSLVNRKRVTLNDRLNLNVVMRTTISKTKVKTVDEAVTPSDQATETAVRYSPPRKLGKYKYSLANLGVPAYNRRLR